MTLTDKVKSVLDNSLTKKIDLDFYKNYHDKFKISGEHKARSVINQIQSLITKPNLSKTAYISLGGSEGSEIIYILQNTDVRVGVLMEIDSYACQIAKEKSINLLHGKTLYVIPGDVTDQVKNLHAILQKEKQMGTIEGIIIAANAVFHEFPYRSKNYELNTFLSELFWDWKQCIFICREPCKPFNWPDLVEIAIPKLSSDLLFDFAQKINAKLKFASHVVRCGPEFVAMSSELAVETIHKLFYIEDFEYEVQEKLTGIDPDKFVSIIENQFGKNSVFQIRLNSASFSRKYQEIGIKARDLNGNYLTIPLSFINIIASKRK